MTPLEETMKIHYFEDGITDSSFASIKSTIMVDCKKFQEFNAVMWLYVNFKCTQKAEAPTHQAHNVSASKVTAVADKAMRGVVEAAEVDLMPAS